MPLLLPTYPYPYLPTPTPTYLTLRYPLYPSLPYFTLMSQNLEPLLTFLANVNASTLGMPRVCWISAYPTYPLYPTYPSLTYLPLSLPTLFTLLLPTYPSLPYLPLSLPTPTPLMFKPIYP